MRRSCCLTVPGWIAARWSPPVERGVGHVSRGCLACLLVNVFYPEWTGGWSTGPRLLVPLLPFAILPIAGLLAGEGLTSRGSQPGSRWRWHLPAESRCFSFRASAGEFRTTSSTRSSRRSGRSGAASRLPVVAVRRAVLPQPRPCSRSPTGSPGSSPRWQGIQFLPLVLFQAAGLIGLWRFGLDDRRNAPAREDCRATRTPCPAASSGVKPGY